MSLCLVEVCTSKTKRNHPYHRLLFAMSLYDAAESIWYFLSTWPIPASQSDDQIWAIGTTQTCSAQGFFLMLGVAVPIYNALLGLFFFLVVINYYNATDQTL